MMAKIGVFSRGLLLCIATLAIWFAWLGWDVKKDVDPITNESTGPYNAVQVLGCIICLAVFCFYACRWLNGAIVVIFLPISFAVGFAISTSFYARSGLWALGFVLVYIGTTVGALLVAMIAEVFWRYRDESNQDREHKNDPQAPRPE